MICIRFSIFVIATLCTFQTALRQSKAQDWLLETGVRVAHDLDAGQRHRYSIQTPVGQFLRVIVSQTELDFELAILDSQGRRHLECRRKYLGNMSLSWQAETDRYYVEIASPGKDSAKGRYEIALAEMRAVKAEDKLRLAAEKSSRDAETLNGKKDEESRRRAIVLFEEALTLWRELGDGQEEAATLISLGRAHYFLSEEKKALARFNEAFTAWEKVGDAAGLAESWFNLGNVNYEVGEIPKALSCYENALKLWKQLKQERGQARCSVTLGVINNQLGNHQTAINLFRQAKEINRKLRDKSGAATALNGLSDVYLKTGYYKLAEDTCRESLTLLEESGELTWQALAQSALGESLLLQRRAAEALVPFTQESSIAERLGDSRVKATAYRHLGMAYEALGEKSKAQEHYQKSLALNRESNNRQEEAANLNSLGYLQEARNDKRGSLSTYQTALLLSRSVADSSEEITILRNLARLQRDLEQLKDARANAEEAIHKIESIRQQVSGRQFRASYFATVQQSYSVYVDVLMRQHRQQPNAGLDVLALQASERYRARSLLDSLAEAKAEIRKDVPEDLLKHEQELQRLLNFKSERQMTLLSGPSNKEEAETIARELRSLEAEYEQLQIKIRQAAPSYAALTQPDPVTFDEIQKQLLDDRTVLLVYSLGDERSYLWAVTNRSLESYELPASEVIETKAREVHELITAPQRIDRRNPELWLRQTRQAEEKYWQQAAELSRVLFGPIAAKLGEKRLVIVGEGALQRLPFAALPQPTVGKVEKTPLGNRPTAMSPAQSAARQPLLLNHEIVYLPSVSVLAEMRKNSTTRQIAPKTLAIFADPIFNKDDKRILAPTSPTATQLQRPQENSVIRTEAQRSSSDAAYTNDERRLSPLPGTKDEAGKIGSLVPRDSVLVKMGAEANVESVKSADLSQYRLIHFATHGVLDNEHPELSGLIFSRFDSVGRRREGTLRMQEIYNLKLAADVVVLSSCEGGIGKEVRGEGLIALTRGFFYAGSPRVVASLWKADDDATPILMQEFYQKLINENCTPAKALRAAQLAVRERQLWQSPYYWAAFVLQGEYK